MIVEALFKLFFGFIDFIISLIPNIDVDFGSWFSALGTVFAYVHMFCDIRLLLLIISTVLIRDNFIFLKNIFMAIVNKLPFIG
ncbi:hypothetical protein KQI58_09785 [Enterococcus raffinosus]|uniref:hypothetical protein n=1 Tax=Enterococcus raffinosus TaxID=71452 RepID=UPI001C103E5B|nr:hypothetical protein [Enterococcus raffinosus]MBU5361366.1 hypothetical protein [Enterococcus raffinosus]